MPPSHHRLESPYDPDARYSIKRGCEWRTVHLLYSSGMATTPQTTFPVTEARACLGDLARRASAHEHITLTERGRPTAVLISPEELEDLEDSLALARLELSRARGERATPISNIAARQLFLEAAGLTEDPR